MPIRHAAVLAIAVAGLTSAGLTSLANAQDFKLLERTPNPSDEEIKDTLGGHICRCTGYQAIVEAVHLAAKKLAAAPGKAV